MPDAVIVATVRTPVGKRNGALSAVHPVDLSAHVLESLVGRAGIEPRVVDDVIWGCVSQAGEQAPNIGRNAVLAAGWPEEIPGTTVDRQCGSSQQAVHFAAAAVIAGQADVVIAGGVESMSRVPMGSNAQGPGQPYGPRINARYGGVSFNQGVGAEMVARQWGLSRTEVDEIALRSHQLAAAATDSGAFADEIAPVTLPDGTVLSTDEGIRRETSMEALGGLKTVFDANGVVTAGNASQISDGAAAVLVTTPAKAAELGLTPLVRVRATAVVGVDPVTMLTGPIPATKRVLERAGLRTSDIGVFEVNEAFAPVIGAWWAEIEKAGDLDRASLEARTNPRGGAIALGHPLGGSGARLMTTLISQMRAGGHRYGLQTMCEGGGMANATILELV